MKHIKNPQIPHKLKMLIQSPGFHRVLYLREYYSNHYNQVKSFEQFGILFLIVMLTMRIFKVFGQIGLIGKMLVFVAGCFSVIVVLTPLVMLLLKYKVKRQENKMTKILRNDHLQKYYRRCIKLSRKIVNKSKKKA